MFWESEDDSSSRRSDDIEQTNCPKEYSVSLLREFKLLNEKHGISVDSKEYHMPKWKSFIEQNVEELLSVTTSVHEQYLFPDVWFEEIKLMSKHINQDTTSHLPLEGGTYKEGNLTCDKDGFLALLVYYMKQQEYLKPKLGIIANFETFCVELLRLESKENSEDFISDLYKVLFASLNSCIHLMNHMFKKTGYIYPINLPSIHNAGDYYRVSLTRVLPKPCYLYLQKRENIPYLELSKIEKFYEQLISSTTDESRKKEFQFKCETFKRFFPTELFGDEIVIENNFVDMLFNKSRINDTNIKFNQVKCNEDRKKLFRTCSVLSKSLIELLKRVYSELDLPFNNNCTLLNDEISLPLMEEIHFKLLRKHANSVYLVEKMVNGKWKKTEVIKVCKSFEVLRKEALFGSISCSDSNKIIVVPYYEPIKKLESNERVALLNLAKELSLLHSLDYVHCDLKPDHLVIDPLRDTGFRLLDFEFVVLQGQEVIGYTKGFHPPEYDCLEIQESAIATTKADVFSLGMCVLHFLNNNFKTNRSEIPHYLSLINDLVLREVLTQMLELDSSKRLSSASDIIRLLENSMEDDNNP